jgi:GxxExxY protein
MIDRELSGLVLDSVFEVHRELGPGLLELPYRNALFYSLRSRGLRVEMERGFTVDFRGERVGEYFADLVVEGRIILEVKAIQAIGREHYAQLINYLRISGCTVGYVINFAPSRFEYKRMVLERSG